MADRRRRDDLHWIVECKFRNGSELSKEMGPGWGAYMGGFRSKNSAVEQCRFERSKEKNRTRFRAIGLTLDEYEKVFPPVSETEGE